MNVITSSTLSLVLLLVAFSYASPMFGMGGMMKRRFPGASDMSYHTYFDITNANAAAAASRTVAGTGGAAVAPRNGGSNSGDTSWMFGNGLAVPSSVASSNQPGSFTQSGSAFNQQPLSLNQQPSSLNQQPASFNQQPASLNQQQVSFNQQQASFNQQPTSFNQQGLPLYPQDFQGTYQGRYPSVWDPRGSYAPLQFPYHAPTHLDYDEVLIPHNKIYNDYY